MDTQHIIRDLYATMGNTLAQRCTLQKKRTVAKGGMYFKNEFYQTPSIDRIHIEHAHTVPYCMPDIQVFHSTFLPNTAVNFPVVLGIDLVRLNRVFTLAIADATLVCGTEMPPDYRTSFDALHTTYWGNVPSKTRHMPEWGGLLFSESCVYLGAPMDTDRFVEYTYALVDMHLEYQPAVATDPGYPAEAKSGLERYCALQRSNKKTFNILENCLGTVLAEEYMHKIMFPY